MIKKEIHLFKLGKSDDGMVISPMLASFAAVEDEPTAFDPHRHDTYGIFLLRSGEMTMLVEEHEVAMREPSVLLYTVPVSSSKIKNYCAYFLAEI